jgi:hypothetical protein
MCASPAFSQEAGMSQKEAEPYAKMVFRADIEAGRLTVEKAAAFLICANERYAKKLDPQKASELSDATEAVMEHRDRGARLSDAEKAQYGRAYRDAATLQREAEDGCRRELGIDPAVKRLFSGLGHKRK